MAGGGGDGGGKTFEIDTSQKSDRCKDVKCLESSGKCQFKAFIKELHILTWMAEIWKDQ